MSSSLSSLLVAAPLVFALVAPASAHPHPHPSPEAIERKARASNPADAPEMRARERGDQRVMAKVTDCRVLARSYREGGLVPADPDKAAAAAPRLVERVKAACEERRLPKACQILAAWYREGSPVTGGEVDHEASQRYVKRVLDVGKEACDEGRGLACAQLAEVIVDAGEREVGNQLAWAACELYGESGCLMALEAVASGDRIRDDERLKEVAARILVITTRTAERNCEEGFPLACLTLHELASAGLLAEAQGGHEHARRACDAGSFRGCELALGRSEEPASQAQGEGRAELIKRLEAACAE